LKFPHTHFSRGQRLRIVLRDGTVLVRRFVDRRGRHIEVADVDTGSRERIPTRSLKVVSIYKGAPDCRAVSEFDAHG
jgi:hypothetical protein